MLWQPTRGLLQPNQSWRRPTETVAGLIPTTWNPSDKSAGMSLPGGTNLVARNANGSGFDSARSVDAITGNVYFEIVWTNYLSADGTGIMMAGILSSAGSLTTSLIAQANAVGYRDDGLLFLNFSGIGSCGNTGSGDNIGFAVDDTNKKIWCRVNGVQWDAGGGDNPATNTGGVSYSGITGTIYAAINSNAFAFEGTAKFDSASWTYAAPSGFGVLGH